MAATVVYPTMQVRPDGTTTTMDPDGTIHSMGSTPVATTSTAGKVKPDGSTITVDNDGTIHGTRPDWDESDADSPAYVANRPFYEAHEHKTLIDGYYAEELVYPKERDPGHGLYADIPVNGRIEAGKTYRVTMSGRKNGTWDVECKASGSYPAIACRTTYGDLVAKIECEDQTGTSVSLRLYTYKALADAVAYGRVTVTVEYVLDELVQVPERFLPVATSEANGVVRPDGTSITIDSDGTIHGTSGVPLATTSTAGKVKPDGTTITIDPDGTIHGSSDVPVATASTAGKVRPDGGTIAVSDGVISVSGPRWEVRRDSGGRLRLAIVIPEVSYG